MNNCKSIEFYREYVETVKNNSLVSGSNSLPETDIDFTRSTIKFIGVSFKYPNSKDYVLKDINLEIKYGNRLGIVGLNGSGKTTLIKLLTRIYEPTEGIITINNVNIKDIPYSQYISHIGVVLQDFSLFAYSVKENIIFDKVYDVDKFNKCIEKSGLNNKIDSLAYGVDTYLYKELNDEGVEFSGGEGQKLALARAIYKNADLLILDEPTSALDPLAEYGLFSQLNSISDGKTTIFISHRLSSTRFCDEIIVLSEGNILEHGSHDDLIRLSGFYAELYKTQAKYYEENGVEIC